MKKLLVALAVVGVTAIGLTAAIRSKNCTQRVEPTLVVPVAANAGDAEMPNQIVPQPAAEEPAETFVATTQPIAPQPTIPAVQPSVASSFSLPVQTVVSRQSSYAQKQAAWEQLLDAHQLDAAITELERAVKAGPKTAEYPAALGIAYVQKLRTLQDFREQSILAIKADQTFDQALELDPSNWEARFWKAASLSYWPEGLNKSDEVIENFVTLVEQQETQPPQSQFAETYVRLGEQYQKAGYADYARETWQRGAALFPGDNAIREKLAGLQ